jgi:hypothetical protein
MVPSNYVSVTNEDDVKNLQKMLDMFETTTTCRTCGTTGRRLKA